MVDATGETKQVLRVAFDRRLKLEFHGARITSDGGLLAYHELDDALGLTATAASTLAEGRCGKNIRHSRSRKGSSTCVGPGCPAPYLPGQRGPAAAVRARLQPDQLPAQPSTAERGGAMVALDPAREAGEDRRPDRAPRPLPRVPAGRGGGAACPVRRDPAPDRPPARTARRGGLTRASREDGPETRREPCAEIDRRHQSGPNPPAGRSRAAPCAWDLPPDTHFC